MSRPFTELEALVVPLGKANIDTDAILPKQFMKSIRRTGFGDNLFDEWRYLDVGEPEQDCSSRPKNPDFVLNQARYRGAQILLTRENFGCGSSREHAPWALRDFGFRVLIAPSFADIFFSNCVKNGILAAVLDNRIVDRLMDAVVGNPGYRLHVGLAPQTLTTPDGEVIPFTIAPAAKVRLAQGLDEIALTLRHAQRISGYERLRKEQEPWIFSKHA